MDQDIKNKVNILVREILTASALSYSDISQGRSDRIVADILATHGEDIALSETGQLVSPGLSVREIVVNAIISTIGKAGNPPDDDASFAVNGHDAPKPKPPTRAEAAAALAGVTPDEFSKLPPEDRIKYDAEARGAGAGTGFESWRRTVNKPAFGGLTRAQVEALAPAEKMALADSNIFEPNQ